MSQPFSDYKAIKALNATSIKAGAELKWVILTKRTEDPKLAWLINQLDMKNIPNKIEGSSWHAPLLWVDSEFMSDALTILALVDEISDDDPLFNKYVDEPPEPFDPKAWGWVGQDGMP